MARALFPAWTNGLARLGAAALLLSGPAAAALAMVATRTPYVTAQGQPIDQPVLFDHRHHVVDDGIDCRYCHGDAERSRFAGVPPTSVCMNCHAQVWKDAPALTVVRSSAATGRPIPWKRVHTIPGFAYFDHSAHVTRGVGCAECHGRVDLMPRVVQVATLTMGWCLDCHRDPAPHLRPQEAIADLAWTIDDRRSVGQTIAAERHIAPPTDCSACHR